MERWQIVAGVIGTITAFVATVYGLILKRRTDKEGNEILTFQTVSTEMRDLREELRVVQSDLVNCRRDHADSLKELGKQNEINMQIKLDLKAAHDSIRELRKIVEGDHEVLEAMEKLTK